MRFLSKKIFYMLAIFFMLALKADARPVVAILSDNLKPVSTNYMVYPETSNLIAQDVANLININQRLKALPVCNSVSNAEKREFDKQILQFVKEYQYTYNLNYDILRKISDDMGADYILLISTGLDVQSSFLKETVWNKFPIAGENCVNPHYRVITQVTLIDPKHELILLERGYSKSIASKEFDLAIPEFSPSPSQLNKIKEFSVKIANRVTPEVETELVPELMPVQRTIVDKVLYKYGYGHINNPAQNIAPQDTKAAPKDDNFEIKVNPNLKLYNYVNSDL